MMKRAFILILIAYALTLAQDEEPERITVEEIKINFSAFDSNGRFINEIGLNDFVILENGRIHQPASVRYLPANVLILIDVGSEISYAKRRKISAQAALSLVRALRKENSVAVMQYAEKAEITVDWTTDKQAILEKLDERKLNLGKRSNFYLALVEAIELLKKAKSNRHLVIITDGIDSSGKKEIQNLALTNLFSSDINVHVVSWTNLQKKAIEKSLKTSPNVRKVELPPGAEPPVQGTTPNFPVMTINLDRETLRRRKQEIEKLKQSEQILIEISENTNGEIFLPDSEEEMIEKMTQLAQNIDSQYTATYIPRVPLTNKEVRLIEVFSRKQGLIVQGKRKLIVARNP